MLSLFRSKLFLTHIFIALWVFSWLAPSTRAIWDWLDVETFKFLNSTILQIPDSVFWALANHKKADLVMWAMIMFITIRSILALSTREERVRRLSKILFGMVFLVIAIAITRNTLRIFLDWIEWSRTGPSLIFPDAVRLSKLHPEILMKDASVDSFPGDHGIVISVWAGLIIAFAGWRIGASAIIAASLVCLPRLVAGAHWLTDIAIGSVSIAAFIVTWGVHTPFIDKASAVIERGIYRIFFRSNPQKEYERTETEH